MNTRIHILLSALATLLVAPPMRAQEVSYSTGLSVGADALVIVMRTNLVNEANETPAGVGVRMQAAYGFTPKWAVWGSVQRVSVRTGSSEALGTLSTGVRYTFGDDDSPFRPYLEAGVGVRSIDTRHSQVDAATRTLRSTGGSTHVTGGLQFFEFGRMAIDAALSIDNGTFRAARADGERVSLIRGNAPATALRVGVRWFFGDRVVDAD